MILLTGATGAAGSFIAKEFVEQREPVRILVRNRVKANWLEKVPTVEVENVALADGVGDVFPELLKKT
jgi:nucleoside-diphosphate-sugar epimerase